jgi:hypothetical protein
MDNLKNNVVKSVDLTPILLVTPILLGDIKEDFDFLKSC